MDFPVISEDVRVRMLEYPKTERIEMVLDTDAATEVDDQFAIAYALLSRHRLDVQAVYAAPFAMNERAQDPAEGMEMSYNEILHIMRLAKCENPEIVFRGSTRYLKVACQPEESPAALDLIRRACCHTPENPLYIVAIGAATNVANAILLLPDIIKNMVVIWLAGDDLANTPNTYNVYQDVYASQTVFNSGVPLVFVPCNFVASHMTTSMPELCACIGQANPLCDYLIDIVGQYNSRHFVWSKHIWDLAAIGYVITQEWSQTGLHSCPIITSQLTYSFDTTRHLFRVVKQISRDDIFRDCFTKLKAVER